MISVSVTNDFMKIKDDWNRLYESNNHLSYYQSSAVMSTLWRGLYPYRFILRISPRFYVFRNDREVIMILPLFKRWLSNKYTGYGYKAGIGYIDAVYADSISESELSCCFRALRTKYSSMMILMQHVQSETALGNWIQNNSKVVSNTEYTIIPLYADYNMYYSSLSKHMKQNLRTAYNRLSTDNGTYEFECISYSQMDGLDKDLQSLYIERQIKKYGKNWLYKFFVKHVDLGTKIQRSKEIDIRAFILRINGRIAAYYDGLFSSRGVIVPRLAIADGFDRYSPGVMLLNESIKYLIGSGMEYIDLTHGTEEYKLFMGGSVHKCVGCKLEIINENNDKK